MMKKHKTLVEISLLFMLDATSIVASLYLALYLRFNGPIDNIYLSNATTMILPIILISVAVFMFFELYHSILRYASILELKNILMATIMDTALVTLMLELSDYNLPRSCYVIYFLLITMFLCGTRFAYRIAKVLLRGKTDKPNRHLEKVMIIGAGEAGERVYREIATSSHVFKKVACFIDDDTMKWNKTIHGVIVAGGRNVIIDACNKHDIVEIIVAMPSAERKDIAEILNICKETKCRLKRMPGIYQLINGEVHLSDLKEVEIQDLLGRDPVSVDLNQIMRYVSNQVIMVTGGGGSIGSELCRQIAAAKPKQLIIVDIYENNAYDIQLELKHDYPHLKLETIIASVRNAEKIERLFDTYRPDIVYHAAAHKHVPLMEDSPCEAIKNNVFGTLNVAKAADKYHTKKFILISTDKAVNPTNVMGATKRMCEMIVQTFNQRSMTDYVAVRFGNVLGSNGSVIPIFKKQIAEGGPVTVTHKDIIRYFMTIPEAVSLVLQAGAYAQGGEIFILDMGDPVKIADMARNLIKLSGYEPDVDIMIQFTGLRPGEKLYEELLMEEEGLQDTPNHMIHIGKPIEINEEMFLNQLDKLYDIAYSDTVDIRIFIKEVVDTYHYRDEKEEVCV